MGRKKLDPTTSTKRALILKAAGKMFVKQGYSSVSMDAIADAVPVSKRTLYNHFADKKALFTAVMQSRCQQVFQMMEDHLVDERSVDRVLTDVGGKFIDIVLNTDALDMYRTVIMESQKFPELGKLFYESGPQRTRGLLAEYLSNADARGVLEVPNPEMAAALFLGMLLNRVQMQCLLGVKKLITPQERNDIIHYAVDVFVRAHAAQ